MKYTMEQLEEKMKETKEQLQKVRLQIAPLEKRFVGLAKMERLLKNRIDKMKIESMKEIDWSYMLEAGDGEGTSRLKALREFDLSGDGYFP